MKDIICNIINALIVISGMAVSLLYAISIQSTKSWETFLPNIGILLAIVFTTFGLLYLVNRIAGKK